MKSNPVNFNTAKQDFTAIAISSTIGGFIPTEADLIKKDCNFVPKLQSFFGAGDGT